MSELTAIKLYFCPLNSTDLDTESAALINTWLPQDEIDKVNRYIKQEAKEHALMVRGFLRALLSKHSDILPADWCFEYGDKGKPRLSEAQFKQTGIHFNLSHSGDWLLVGICPPRLKAEYCNEADAVEFGVDIERCRSSTNIYSILSHYFSEPEKAALLALPAEFQRARFFDLWALKESYIKAKGLGLALSLKSFAFDFSTLVETSLKLGVIQGVSPLAYAATSELGSSPIRLKQNIALSTQQESEEEQVASEQPLQKMKAAQDWHCWLGHLDVGHLNVGHLDVGQSDEQYRFAISVGQCKQVSIKAMSVDLKALLERV
ncbi:4'-phosphopantetheinyl transferase [Shewanella halifaxensis HAW-EB4]|uniref:4'-phosphopantetheinyl transferase n=1 Tax=Shewanella halifaxensis (strain HAW-EB4) TaxID=458817 RepID=B0TPA7_SHEHH|nr:4'-phosphopantetheinyl transferase superfamily protein [Shewanella halifaxensis]ABZ77554.1 4'-phosphopantetheinyl transferase [Shewanella halifaxensis HAW-EB4]